MPTKYKEGAFARVWLDGDAAVKVTRDESDVAGLLDTQDIQHVVRVRDAWKLQDSAIDATGRPVDVFAVRMERLGSLPEAQSEWLSWMPRRLLTEQGGYDFAKRKLADKCGLAKAGDECQKFTSDVVDTFAELNRRGISWRDAHVKNVGVDRAGVWKIVDLGASGKGLSKKLPII